MSSPQLLGHSSPHEVCYHLCYCWCHFIQMMVSLHYMWAICMSILDSLSLAQMKNRKHGSRFWGDERKTKQRQTTRKRHPQNGRTQRQLLQGINEQGDLGKPQRCFPSETKSSSWGPPQRAMLKEGWQIPAGLAQMQHRATRRKQCVLFRSSVRLSISTSFLAGWDRAPHSTGYSEVAGEK